MSNHLRELIEAWESRSLATGNQVPEYFDEIVDRFIAGAGARAICFDAGGIDDICSLKAIAEMVRLPYESVWIECEVIHGAAQILVGFLCGQQDSGNIHVQAFTRSSGEWRLTMFFTLNLTTNKTESYPFFDGKSVQQFAFIPRAFLTALNCVNIRSVEIAPSEKLQKARQRRGKKPLFSTWTLMVAVPKEQQDGERHGGTHESRRLHLCRGHIKRRKTGCFWWHPHVRGDKRAGMIHKDYAASYRPAMA